MHPLRSVFQRVDSFAIRCVSISVFGGVKKNREALFIELFFYDLLIFPRLFIHKIYVSSVRVWRYNNDLLLQALLINP